MYCIEILYVYFFISLSKIICYIIVQNKIYMDKKKYSLQDFQLLSVFGYGNYSKVALVRKKDDQKIYAMKVIKKESKVKGIKRSHAFI